VPFTLKQLSYFVAAGEAGSILRAAENIQLIKRTIVVEIFSLFCQQQINTDNIPGMAWLQGHRGRG